MRNVEIKRIINGEFAVIMEDSRDYDKTDLKEEKHYLNLDQIESFKIGKTSFENRVNFERKQNYCEDKDEYIYDDDFPKESSLFKYSAYKSWELTIPKGTPQIRVYFSKYKFDMFFFNQEEYEKVYKLLISKNVV